MGKIRVKAFDESSPEDEAKLKAKREAKKAEKMAAKNDAKVAAGKKTNPQTDGTMKNSETPSNDVIASDNAATIDSTEEIITIETVVPKDESPVITNNSSEISEEKPEKKTKKEKFAKTKVKGDSKRHKENMSVISKNQSYTLDQALEALKKFKKSNFDETVELHINTKEKGINGTVTLPHGTGKTLIVKVADDTIIAEVAKGKINFDILVASPSMMPTLARVAKILGPRGLMPNPKNGTIAENTAEAVKKLSGGQISYKTESEAPIIHARVGKISFEDAKLKDNVKTFLASVGQEKINSVILKSTMSPAIRLDYLSL